MRKLLLALFFVFGVGYVQASHLQGLNASNLSLGVVPNARIDCASVTCFGSNIPNFALPDSIVRTFEVTIATTSDLYGADIVGNNNTTIESAIARLNSTGKTLNSNGTVGNIFLYPGSYFMNDPVTIPSNITLKCIEGSSTSLVATNPAKQLVINFGTIDGCVLDGAGVPFSVRLVDQKTNGKIQNVKFVGMRNQSNGTAGSAILGIADSSYTVTRNVEFVDPRYIPGVSVVADNAAILVLRSSYNIIDGVYVSTIHPPVGAGDNNPGFMGILQSANNKFTNFRFQNAGYQLIDIQGGSFGNEISNSFFRITEPQVGSGPTGIINFWPSNGMPISSGNVIMNNTFEIKDNRPGSIITLELGTVGSSGTIINGNRCYSIPAVSPKTFILISGTAGAFATAILNNIASGLTFITDTGKNTRFTNNDNFDGDAER